MTRCVLSIPILNFIQMGKSCWTISQHVIFDIFIPTIDTYGDINFAVSAFHFGHIGVGCAISFPVIMHLFFTFYTWKSTDLDSSKEKRFTWLLLILNIWKQYQILKLIFFILSKNSKQRVKEHQKKIHKYCSNVEGFVESIPQYFISLSIFMIFATRGIQTGSIPAHPAIQTITNTTRFIHNKTRLDLISMLTHAWSINRNRPSQLTQVFGKTTLGISNEIMFPLSILMSMLVGIKCVMNYLSNGPIGISSDKKWKRFIILVAELVYTISAFYGKVILVFHISMLMTALTSTGMLSFLVLSTILFILPILGFFAPLARYLTFRQLIRLILRNPPLLVLHFITDFAFGPEHGYGKSNFRGCSYINQCCFCICCCKPCRFEEGGSVTISKGLSWIKMAYSKSLVLLFYWIVIVALSSYESNDPLVLMFLSLLPFGTAGFAVTLHSGGKYGVIDMKNEASNGLEINY